MITRTRILGAGFMAAIIIAMVIMLTITGCTTPDDLDVSKETQQNVMTRANASVPNYQPQKFPAKEDINTYLRETEERTNWYVYALNKDGIPMFYIVSSMKPRNLCTSLTSPDRVIRGSQGAMTTISSPALDGVYYGTTNCGDTHYMMDVATGNFIEISGKQFTLITSKVPLALETDPLQFIQE